MISFAIYKHGKGHYYVVLLTVNGDIILRGTDCANILACHYSIDSIRANATDFSKYELTDSHLGNYFFELKEPGGKGIARSILFETVDNVCSRIEFVRRNIPNARVE